MEKHWIIIILTNVHPCPFQSFSQAAYILFLLYNTSLSQLLLWSKHYFHLLLVTAHKSKFLTQHNYWLLYQLNMQHPYRSPQCCVSVNMSTSITNQHNCHGTDKFLSFVCTLPPLSGDCWWLHLGGCWRADKQDMVALNKPD